MSTTRDMVKSFAGRPRGSLGKISEEARDRARSCGDLSHEFLLRVMRGEIIYRDVLLADGIVVKRQEHYDFYARIDAAKAAAPYYAPKISTVLVEGSGDNFNLALAAIAARLPV